MAYKALIICNRGIPDNKAYMDEIEFAVVIKYICSNEVEIQNNYDTVFHLVTAAKAAEEFYATGNKSDRTETVEETATLDRCFFEIQNKSH